MITIRAKLLAGLALASLVSICQAQPEPGETGDKIKELMEKVDDVVNWKLQDLGVEPKDLSEIYEGYLKLSDKDKAELEIKPLAKLTIDFALKPCKFREHQVAATDELANENYMNRLARVLRYFWPAYQGKILSRIDFGRRLYKMKKLVVDLREGKMPTVNDLLAIKREHKALLARAQEIIDHEDIFSNLQEYAEVLQGYNWIEHRAIMEELIAHVGPKTTAAELTTLVEQFKTKYGALFNA